MERSVFEVLTRGSKASADARASVQGPIPKSRSQPAEASRMWPIRPETTYGVIGSSVFALAAWVRVAVSGAAGTDAFIPAFIGAAVGVFAVRRFGTGDRLGSPQAWPANTTVVSTRAAERRQRLTAAPMVVGIAAYVTWMPADAMPGVIAISIVFAINFSFDLRNMRRTERTQGVRLYRPARRWNSGLQLPNRDVYARLQGDDHQ